jgi:hypothetical protein
VGRDALDRPRRRADQPGAGAGRHAKYFRSVVRASTPCRRPSLSTTGTRCRLVAIGDHGRQRPARRERSSDRARRTRAQAGRPARRWQGSAQVAAAADEPCTGGAARGDGHAAMRPDVRERDRHSVDGDRRQRGERGPGSARGEQADPGGERARERGAGRPSRSRRHRHSVQHGRRRMHYLG